jgi:DNA-binding MarR family transcriptional regulator
MLNELLIESRQLVTRLEELALAGDKLSRSGAKVLRYLADHADTVVTPTQLARHCQISTPAMTQLLSRLEQQALVQRWHAKADRRQVLVRLTRTGASLAEQSNATQKDLQQALQGSIPESDLHTTLTTLARVNTLLQNV